MSVQPDMRLFRAPDDIQEAELPAHIKERNLKTARDKGLDIGNYDAEVLYAVQGDLQNSEKARRVLEAQDLGSETPGLSSYIGPRLGTITQWSDMVGDILTSTGVESKGRVEKVIWHKYDSDTENAHALLGHVWHDRMTQTAIPKVEDVASIFQIAEKGLLKHEDIISKGKAYLEKINKEYGLAMYQGYVDYLFNLFTKDYQRNPTDAELYAFAFANSEHCDHGVFNGLHNIDGRKRTKSFFDYIRDTNKNHPGKTRVAYKDDAAAYEGEKGIFTFTSEDGLVSFVYDTVYNTLKVESHNHPTRIYALEGAATGIGGLLRDLAAIGRGGTPNATSTTFIVSDLIDAHNRTADGTESPLDIIAEGPLGAAKFSNEAGYPNITGNFSVLDAVVDGQHYGADKPTAIVGGKGNVFPENVESREVPVGARILYIGGSVNNIGFGGGAASSVTTDESTALLDFKSVQRASPIMQSKAQDSINALAAKKGNNPILKIGDVGASGWTNTTQELLHDVGRGGEIDFSRIPVADKSASPATVCSDESQERFMAIVDEKDVPEVMRIAKRFNTPVYDVGVTTTSMQYVVYDPEVDENIINMDINDMLGHDVELTLTDTTVKVNGGELDYEAMNLADSVKQTISHPNVGNKDFLVTIGDRSVGGRVTQDQMVGPWQTPLANAGVTLHGLEGIKGEVITQANRAALAIVNSEAASRMSITTAILKALSANITDLSSISCSGNWMYSKNAPGQLASLEKGIISLRDILDIVQFDISVGKDSGSMEVDKVLSPVTLVTTIYADAADVRKTLTPDLKPVENTELCLIDFGEGKNRLGGSTLAQSYKQFGNDIPDINNPQNIRNFMEAMIELQQAGLILAYHKKSDGGLLATISEMSFGSHLGVDVNIADLVDEDSHENRMRALFNEEAGVVLQFDRSRKEELITILSKYNLTDLYRSIGQPNFTEQNITFMHNDKEIINERRVHMQKAWSETSLLVKGHRKNNNPETTRVEFDRIDDENEPPMQEVLTFDITEHPVNAIIADYEQNEKQKPKAAVLSTEGTNSQEEMKRYFNRGGFEVYDVHLNDLKSGKYRLSDFTLMGIAGGFSHGDTLGAGVGFARTILETPELREQFSNYKGKLFGPCNGFQVITRLAEILPGGDKFPKLVRNTSLNFEARKVLVSITENPDSVFFKGMDGSIMTQINSHGEGQQKGGSIPNNVHYVDHYRNRTESYPHNPNGSPGGATGFEIGNICGMMGHPEREWEEDSSWLQMIYNIREAVEIEMQNKK